MAERGGERGGGDRGGFGRGGGRGGPRGRCLDHRSYIKSNEEEGKSLIKKLASCKQSIRDRSLRTVLLTWLPEQTEVPDEDMKKLWQGIFYCFWHADKAPYQSELIDRLSSALQSLPLPLSIHYFTGFLFTMRREWSRIDHLRLDKFYLLIRRFLHGFFTLIDNYSWDLEFTGRLMGILFNGTFLASDKFQGNGVSYHIASVFVEELRSYLPLRKEVVVLLFGPFVSILGIVNDKILLGKIKSNLFEELLKMGKRLLDVKKSGNDVEPDDGVLVLGSIALSIDFARRFYELGSSAECHQGNRKLIFSLHKEFLQLEKDLTLSGIEVSIPGGSIADDEVPELVHVSNEPNAVYKSKKIVANGSSKKKGLKKCSKAKGQTKETDDVFDLGNEEAFDETVISNLRTQFEKIASEMGSKDEVPSVCEEEKPVLKAKKTKKRKRGNKGEDVNEKEEVIVQRDEEASLTALSCEKSSKRVRFAMKNNLVWKPHCPLPPQDLRLPPSATPRGSALKKGIPAGPVRELSSPSRKKKKVKTLKKARKGVKTIKTLKKKLSP